MAVAIPQMAVQIRSGDVVCVEVRRSPSTAGPHRVLPPCAFHRAVSRAHHMRRSGERIAMRDVPPGPEPAIGWGVDAGARNLPGWMIRLDDGSTWRHVAPVLGEEDHVQRALDPTRGLGVRHDASLGVSLVHGVTPRGDKKASHSLIDALVDVVARAGVADLEQRLTGTPVAPEPWRPL